MQKRFNTTGRPLRIIEKKLKSYFRGKCIDIGADNGRHLFLMPKGSIGLDHYTDYFEDYTKAGFEGVQCDLNQGILPFKDNDFDTILFSHCLEHIEMPNRIIKEVFRILKSGGTLIVGVPNVYCIHTDFYGPKWDYHINVYDGKALKKLLSKNRFKVMKRFCNFPLGNWFMYALFNYTPLKYFWDDIFFVCKKP